jgi:hypothetical protein
MKSSEQKKNGLPDTDWLIFLAGEGDNFHYP